MRHAGLLPFAALLASGLSCGVVLGLKDGELVQDGGTDGAVVDDKPPLKDAVSLDVNYAQCDGQARTLQPGALFVSPSGTDSGNTDCSQTDPCQTLRHALTVASGKTNLAIYLAPGAYAENATLSIPGLTVEGGWVIDAGAWVPVCDTSQADIVGDPATPSPTLTITNDTTLRLLTVSTRMAPDFSESAYALFVSGGTTTLDNVFTVAQNGGDGVTPGAAMGTVGGPSCTPPGGTGSKGGNGPGGVAGDYGADGYHASMAGGTAGVAGEAGSSAAGDHGDCRSCSMCGSSSGTDVYIGDGGMPDTGSGIDGGPPPIDASCGQPVMVCGADGGAGCGGAPGVGGNPGGGGGASIAIYAWGPSSKVLVLGGNVQTSLAGNGGNGGAGAGGANGTPGAVGMSGVCADPDGGMTPVDGGAGGAGGMGGGGGLGGGGAGGPTYLYVTGNKGQVMTGPAGKVGSPGAGGMPGGAPGLAGASLNLP